MHFKRILWSLTVAIVICSVLAFSAYAAGEELLTGYQQEIDRILVDYLGTTSMTEAELLTAVEQMDWETYQSARWEISILEDEIHAAFASGELSEDTAHQLRDDNPIICAFASALDAKNARDNTVSMLAEEEPLTNVKVTASGSISGNSTKLTITTTGGFYSSSTGTATVTNSTTQKLAFSYSFASGSGWKVGSTAVSSGSIYELMPGESVTFSHTTGSGLWDSAYIYLENLTLSDVASASNVTIYFDTGTASVAGASVTNGETVQIASTGATVTATASNFVAWINKTTNQIVSTSASFTFKPDADISIKAIHGPTARFLIGTYAANAGYLYETLSEATAAASSGSNKTVVLANNGTLASGSYTIPSGVTLLIPYDDANTLCTDAPTVNDSAIVAPTAYRTLTMSNGATIAVNGGISVAGSQTAAYPSNGNVTGSVGVIMMNEGSSITVNEDGALYAWGYVAGSGSVVIEDGGTVYEDFQVRDYRGGDVTTTLTSSSGSNVTTWHIFPMSQYYVQNVQVPMTLKAGAVEYGYFSVTASLMGIKSETVPFIGESSMFQITSGYIIKDYDETSDRLLIDVYGSMEVNQFSIEIQVKGFSSAITIDSSKYDLPLNSNITINLYGTSTIDLNQDLLMLPGSVINIGESATLNVNNSKRLIIYDQMQWLYGNGGTASLYCSDLKKALVPLAYVFNGTKGAAPVSRTTADLVDAKILVNGTLNATNGYLYTTADGGDICSTGSGQVIMQAVSEATAYQIEQKRNNDDDFDSSTELDAHTITSAQLHNGDGTYDEEGNYNNDGTYVATANSTTTPNTYTYTDGFWRCGTHNWDWSAGTCSVCGEKAVRYDAVNLSIEGEILLNFKYYIHADAVTADIAVTVTEEANTIVPDGNTWTKTISDDFKDQDGVRYVISQGIAAGEMTGDVTVAFAVEGKTVPIFDNDDLDADPVTSIKKTVLDYVTLASAQGTDLLKEMCEAAVTFGGYAQKFYGTDPDNPAYNILNSNNVENFAPDVSAADDKLTAVPQTSFAGSNGVAATTQKLNLDSKIYIRTYFTLSTDSEYSYSITGPDNNSTGTLTKDGDKDRYYVDIVNVPPAYWDDDYTIKITGNGGTYTVTTNVLAWCARCVNSTTASEAQKNMARAMYFYNQTAQAYFEAKSAQ